MLSDIKIVIALGAIGAAILLTLIVFLITHKKSKSKAKKASTKSKEELEKNYEKMMQEDVYHIFSKEFHEELRNKARLDFQKVINENAMFLQQDLRLTTSEINEYLKKEVSSKLQEEFEAYQKSIKDVQQAAVDSINTTVQEAEEQQKLLSGKVQDEVSGQKVHMVDAFEANMAKVVNHYIVQALGEQLELKDQLPYILRELESNKDAMRKDMLL